MPLNAPTLRGWDASSVKIWGCTIIQTLVIYPGMKYTGYLVLLSTCFIGLVWCGLSVAERSAASVLLLDVGRVVRALQQ